MSGTKSWLLGCAAAVLYIGASAAASAGVISQVTNSGGVAGPPNTASFISGSTLAAALPSGTSAFVYSATIPTSTNGILICPGDGFVCAVPAGLAGTSGFKGSVDQSWIAALSGTLNETISWGTGNGGTAPNGASLGFANNAATGTTIARGGSYFGDTSQTSSTISPLGNNGTWNGTQLGGMLLANSNTNTGAPANALVDTYYLYFATPIAGFSGFFTYNPTGSGVTLQAYGATGASFESSVDTTTFSVGSTNAGVTMGFLDTSADISYISVTGSNAALALLSVAFLGPTPTPEPLTLALLGSGLLGLGALRRFRSKK